MDITVSGYSVTVSDDYVNQHKNTPATCPICRGINTNRCPVGHPYTKPAPPDPNIWVEVTEDDIFHRVGVTRRFGDGKAYRRRDNQKLAELKLELKKLGIKESDVTDVKRDVGR